MRPTVLAAVVAVVLAGSVPPAAADGSTDAQPCTIQWSNSTPTVGHRLVTSLSVDCNPDEVGALKLVTKVRDVRSQTLKTCVASFAGTHGDQTCSGPYVKRDNVYWLTYAVTATGLYGEDSYAVCVDDGNCDPGSSGGGNVDLDWSHDETVTGPLT